MVEQQDASPWNPSQLVTIDKAIESAVPEEITAALPSVFRAVESSNPNVKLNTVGALIAIAGRPDGTVLLKDYIPRLNPLLKSPDRRLQTATVSVLTVLRPTPPPEAATILLDFVKSSGRDPQAQTFALGTLMRAAGSSPEVVAAAEAFLSRPLDRSTRIDALNALANPTTTDPRLIAAIANALQSPDTPTKLAAIDVLTRIGRPALERAQAALEALAESPTQTPEVKAAAQSALNRISRP